VAVGAKKLQILETEEAKPVALVDVCERDDMIQVQPLRAAARAFNAAFGARIAVFARKCLFCMVRSRAKAVLVPAVRFAVLTVVPMPRATVFAVWDRSATESAFAGYVVQRRKPVRGALYVLALRTGTPIAPTAGAASTVARHAAYFHAGTFGADGMKRGLRASHASVLSTSICAAFASADAVTALCARFSAAAALRSRRSP
jgi:hypothetical protein